MSHVRELWLMKCFVLCRWERSWADAPVRLSFPWSRFQRGSTKWETPVHWSSLGWVVITTNIKLNYLSLCYMPMSALLFILSHNCSALYRQATLVNSIKEREACYCMEPYGADIWHHMFQQGQGYIQYQQMNQSAASQPRELNSLWNNIIISLSLMAGSQDWTFFPLRHK